MVQLVVTLSPFKGQATSWVSETTRFFHVQAHRASASFFTVSGCWPIPSSTLRTVFQATFALLANFAIESPWTIRERLIIVLSYLICISSVYMYS